MRTKFETFGVYNIYHAIFAAREAMNSHDKMDSALAGPYQWGIKTIIGPNDMTLCKRLIGTKDSSERKFLRQIFVCVRITAPAYWFTEFDTYKVGTVRNSSSFMHKGTVRPYVADDFESISDTALRELNNLREQYLYASPENKKEMFCELRSAVPSGYLYSSTVTLNYENILTMFKQRKNHRLSHWRVDFCAWALTLPYMKEFLIAAGIIDENYVPKE